MITLESDELQLLHQATREQAQLALAGCQFETQLQREAALLVEQLRLLTGAVTYAHDRLKGQVLKRLSDGDLWSMHPSNPASLDELLVTAEVGISKSEASDLLAWEKIIYPWFHKTKGWDAWQTWSLLPKTKWRRITRILRALLDPNYTSPSEKVRQSIAKLSEGCHSTEEVVDRLIELAQNAMTTRELEGVIYPSEIPNLVIMVRRDEKGNYHGRFVATQDQLDVLKSYRKVEVLYEGT